MGRMGKRIANLLVHLGTWLPVLLLIIFWKQIPSQIPVHYDAAGEVTRWGGKGSIIVLVIFQFMIYGTHLICMRVVRYMSPPEKQYSRKLAPYVTEEDQEYGIMLTEAYLAWTDALVILLFDEIIWSSAAVQASLGNLLFYGDLVLLAVVFVWYMVLISRRKKQIRLRAEENNGQETDDYEDREERTIGDVDDQSGGLSDEDYEDREEPTMGDVGRVSSEKEDDM